ARRPLDHAEDFLEEPRPAHVPALEPHVRADRGSADDQAVHAEGGADLSEDGAVLHEPHVGHDPGRAPAPIEHLRPEEIGESHFDASISGWSAPGTFEMILSRTHFAIRSTSRSCLGKVSSMAASM